MRILQICQKPPLPAIDGGCLASYELSKILLSSGAELKILAFATEKHPFLPDFIETEFKINTAIEGLKLDTNLNYFRAAKNIFSRKSIQEDRFYDKSVSVSIVHAVTSKHYDVILFDGLMTCVYLDDVQSNTKTKLIYRSHNLEFVVLGLLDNIFRHPGRYLYLKLQSSRLKKFELKVWNQVGQIWSISSNDNEFIRLKCKNKNAVKYIPFSTAPSFTDKDPQENTLFHLASMNWKPNADGVMWFLKKVWPLVLQKHGDVHLHLGGYKIEILRPELQGKNIIIHPEVIDADKFYNEYEIMIVPLLKAGGIRIKIIQALSKGKIIVSTAAAAAGINGINGEHLLICQSGGEMAETINQLVTGKDLKEKLKAGARALFEREYSPEKVKNQINLCLKE